MKDGEPPAAAPSDPWDDRSLRLCLRCGAELPKDFVAACGYKNPCPICRHMYPLGDCSD